MKHKNVFTKVLKRFAALLVILTLTLSLVPITSGVISHAEGEQGNNTNLDFDTDTDDGPDYVDVRTEISYESMVKGTGTEADPYTISSADALIGMRMMIEKNENFSTGKFFKLTKDIDLSGVCGEGREDWSPIGIIEGNDFDTHAFDGTFDGGGHTIKGLYISNGGWSGSGLFGKIETHGKVFDLNVEGNVTGTKNYVGGLAGASMGNSKIEKCTFKGTVNGSKNYIGGIVGYTQGNVVNCKAEGDISGRMDIGGVVGCGYKNIIQNCSFESGTVYGSNRSVGGVVGLCNAKVVSKCSTTAAVKVCGDSGGVAGILGDCTSQTYDCINYATVDGGSGTGGIAGTIYNCGNDTGSVEKCINYGNISAQGSAGGIAGSNKYTVKNCKNYGTVTGNPAGDLVGTGNAATTFGLTTATALTHEKGALIISLIAFAVLAIAGCGIVIYKKRKKQVHTV